MAKPTCTAPPPKRTSKGTPLTWLRQAVLIETEACVEWPFGVDRKGYGRLWFGACTRGAHQVALELAGHPRPPGMEARHSCHRPPCVNPRHLSWGASLDNAADMVAAGRQARGERHGRAVLTAAQVLEIRRRWPAESQYALAAEYGCGQRTVSHIVNRKTWAHL